MGFEGLKHERKLKIITGDTNSLYKPFLKKLFSQ